MSLMEKLTGMPDNPNIKSFSLLNLLCKLKVAKPERRAVTIASTMISQVEPIGKYVIKLAVNGTALDYLVAAPYSSTYEE